VKTAVQYGTSFHDLPMSHQHGVRYPTRFAGIRLLADCGNGPTIRWLLVERPHRTGMRLPVLPRPLRYACALAVALFIFSASVIDPPGAAMGGVFLGIPQDKWLHALAYGGLAGALAYATLAADARTVAVVVVGAVGYGIGIEVVQAFLPLRAFDVADMAANATGATLGGAGWRALGTRLFGLPD
jgi:hypothetical protein